MNGLCGLCPRECGADRYNSSGVCGVGWDIKAAKVQLHYWEEPCISGKNGSGAVFFSGCSLKCVFCQNFAVSHGRRGAEITTGRLSDIFLELQDMGAHNINLVSPTHFVPQIIKALDKVRHRLSVPVIYNCGGYEKVETLRMLVGYIDIFLPDMKYVSSEKSAKYSGAENYFDFASKAVTEMHRQQPKLVWNGELLQKGLIVRHLILPGCRHDSIEVVNWLAENLPTESFLLSLMSQYTPNEGCLRYPELNRRVTTFEYESVLKKAREHGIQGYSQERGSAESSYTPDFDLGGVQEKSPN